MWVYKISMNHTVFWIQFLNLESLWTHLTYLYPFGRIWLQIVIVYSDIVPNCAEDNTSTIIKVRFVITNHFCLILFESSGSPKCGSGQNVRNNLWHSATKWGSLRGVSKLKKVFHCNKRYFPHILMLKWLLWDIPIKIYDCWILSCTISFKTTLYGLSKIPIYVYFYGPIKKQIFHNTSFLSHFHRKKYLWLLCLVW